MNSRRWSRLAVLAAGAVVAAVMLLLGLWQMQVFEHQQDKDAAQRAAQSPVELLERMPPTGDVGDVYGRTVHVGGSWVGGQDVVVVGRDGIRRVLTPLRLADGRWLPVVRGVATGPVTPVTDGAPAEAVGVFMPSEKGEDHSVGADQLASVRLPQLAQRWPAQVAPGFVTLRADDARAQQLEPASVSLPSGHGGVRNFGYAIQWWVFAGFAVAMSIVISRQMRDKVDDDPAAIEAADDAGKVAS